MDIDKMSRADREARIGFALASRVVAPLFTRLYPPSGPSSMAVAAALGLAFREGQGRLQALCGLTPRCIRLDDPGQAGAGPDWRPHAHGLAADHLPPDGGGGRFGGVGER